jgi:dGTPase
LNHSKSNAGVLDDWTKVATLEGEVARISDIVAYVNHDLDDAIRARVITEDDLPDLAVKVLGSSHSERINTMVCDIVECSWAVRSRRTPATPAITMSPPVLEATHALREFLFERVYNVQSVEKEAQRARKVLRRLYHYFQKHPDQLPAELPVTAGDTDRGVADYIAGMTDQFATKTARRLGK